MLSRNKRISGIERTRVLDFLIFKLKHGGNVVQALKSYMDGNKLKGSRPVQNMLDDILAGENYVDAFFDYGLIDRYGHLILSSSVEPAKALVVVRSNSIKNQVGITAIIFKDIVVKFCSALGLGLALALFSKPIVTIFEKMNAAGTATGAVSHPLPLYLAQPWLVFGVVAVTGAVLALIGAWLWWTNKHNTAQIYKFATFRFYEDWSSLLALYLAFKAAGQSDFKASSSLSQSCPEGSFNHELFGSMAQAMRKSGRSFYDVMAQQEGVIPPSVLTFFLDASKTGQIDIYINQAKQYCDERLEVLTGEVKTWVPAITGVVMLMTFGLMVADLFIGITIASMRPITG